MPGIPDVMQKSPVMHRFEAFSRVPGNQNSPIIAQAIARLGGNPADPNNDLLKIAIDLGFYANDAAAVHFRRHWLGRPPNPDPFWPTILPIVDGVLRQGMLKWCQLYRTTGLPAEFWWAASGDQGTLEFQMTVTRYGGRILVVFHTPMVPCAEPLQDSTRTSIIRMEAGAIVTRPTKVPVGSELPDPGAPEAAMRLVPPKKKRVAKKPPRRPGPRPPKKGVKRAKKTRVKKKKRARTRA